MFYSDSLATAIWVCAIVWIVGVIYIVNKMED